MNFHIMSGLLIREIGYLTLGIYSIAPLRITTNSRPRYHILEYPTSLLHSKQSPAQSGTFLRVQRCSGHDIISESLLHLLVLLEQFDVTVTVIGRILLIRVHGGVRNSL